MENERGEMVSGYDTAFLEIMDEDTDGIGDLVVTTLTNEYMPLLRYRIGDLVERRGDRYEFTGRRSDVIVVGGAKVLPGRVEEVLRSVPGVAEARVYGLPSGITGELVAGEIVLADPLPQGFTPDAVRSAALSACRGTLEPHGVPRILDIVKRIATTTAGKTPRRPVLSPHP
jgi:acyl-CoA synthetase (AMP-forming)/AMP-acid ligase II